MARLRMPGTQGQEHCKQGVGESLCDAVCYCFDGLRITPCRGRQPLAEVEEQEQTEPIIKLDVETEAAGKQRQQHVNGPKHGILG